MSLRAVIASAVSSAIAATGDIAETITYVAKSASVYDATTGVLTKADTNYTIKAIIGPFGPAGLGDKTAIEDEHTGALSALFASYSLSIIPDSSDVVIRGGVTYKILQITFDPAGATYRLIMERMG